MDSIIVISIIVVVVCVGYASLSLYLRKRNRQRLQATHSPAMAESHPEIPVAPAKSCKQQRLIDWSNEVLAADSAFQVLRTSFDLSITPRDREWLEGDDQARFDQAILRRRDADLEQAAKSYRNEFEHADGEDKLLEIYLELAGVAEEVLGRLELTIEDVRQEIRRLFNAKVEGLLDRMTDEDSPVAEEFRELFSEDSFFAVRRGRHQDLGAGRLARPRGVVVRPARARRVSDQG